MTMQRYISCGIQKQEGGAFARRLRIEFVLQTLDRSLLFLLLELPAGFISSPRGPVVKIFFPQFFSLSVSTYFSAFLRYLEIVKLRNQGNKKYTAGRGELLQCRVIFFKNIQHSIRAATT